MKCLLLAAQQVDCSRYEVLGQQSFGRHISSLVLGTTSCLVCACCTSSANTKWSSSFESSKVISKVQIGTTLLSEQPSLTALSNTQFVSVALSPKPVGNINRGENKCKHSYQACHTDNGHSIRCKFYCKSKNVGLNRIHKTLPSQILLPICPPSIIMQLLCMA